MSQNAWARVKHGRKIKGKKANQNQWGGQVRSLVNELSVDL